MINSTDLKYFIETAKTQHVSRAAERLGITQPALSHCLKRIEREVGQNLFLRTKQGVILTSAGKLLFNKALDLSAQWEELLQSVKEDVEEVSGTLKIGCHISVAQYTLPEFLPELLREHSKLSIRLTHGLSRHMTEQVVSSQLDVAFAVNPVNHPDLIIKELLKDQVTLWRASELLNPDVLLLEPNLLQTQSLLPKLAKANWVFKRTIESTSLEVLTRLLASGAGHALLPEKVARTLAPTKIQKVKAAPQFEDRICLVYKREFIKTRRGKAFVEAAFQALTPKKAQ